MNPLLHKSTHTGFAHSVRGLVLVEVMVATAIGLFLSAAAVMIFINGREIYSVQDNLSRLQENGRYAIGLNDTATGYDCIGGSEHLRDDVLVVRYASPALNAAFSGNTLYLCGSPLLGRLFSGANQTDLKNQVTGIGVDAMLTSPLIAHAYIVGNTENSCDGGGNTGYVFLISARSENSKGATRTIQTTQTTLVTLVT